MTSFIKEYFNIHPEISLALKDGKPIVALESTVITHGLPFPENLDLARSLETEIRAAGCLPATIAILDGRICVGLEPNQLDQLAQGKDILKVSSRDIAFVVTSHKWGGTTVAGTLAIAQAVGIKVFATGGIGGVHRQAPFDISADLQQLARSQLVVVCAGAKAILDIPATLEVLETNGVPVIGYKTQDFPAFFSLSSGMSVGAQVETAHEVAELAKAHWKLGQQSAVLLAVPPPAEVAMERSAVEAFIDIALGEAQQQGIHGQAVTPFLLSRVSELTSGASLRANLGLLRNNAHVAAEVAQFLYS
ncbi:MAG: pseudouridine-5-phosphate glycosidase [Anaerolineales bacterium]|nr:pseudouridine-5'-phosphate glycosidase [Anaerolineae bacterium]PWB55370.1 MAG: pseudouridine-5-phosphate glycosidase [Anaerolineales bacterium]